MKRFILLFLCVGYTLISNSQEVKIDSGLVAYFPFNGNANDKSENNIDGTTIGNIDITSDRFGYSKNAYFFPGSADSYIDYGTPEATHLEDEITISLWVKFISDLGTLNPRIISNGVNDIAGTSVGFEIFTIGNSDTRKICFVWGNQVLESKTSINSDIWHHVIAEGNTSSMLIYLDGVLDKTISSTISNFNYTQPMYIGRKSAKDYDAFGGIVDDVRLYNRVLNEDEINKLYNEQSDSTFGIFNISPTSAGTNEANSKITIYSSSIEIGSLVKLINDEYSITADSINYKDKFEIDAYFSLNDLPSGLYDIVVISNENDTMKLKDCFTLTELTEIEEPKDTDNDGYRNISTFANLAWVFENDSCWSRNFELDNNIDASETEDWFYGKGFKAITNFSGIIDGQGHKIRNLFFDRPDEEYVAFIGQLSPGGIIRNLALTCCSIEGGDYTAAVVGKNNGGTISNCYATGSISGDSYVSGITGYNSGTIKFCYNAALVNGDLYVGGLTGSSSSGAISESYNIGKIIGNMYLGGIIGFNNGDISNCYNSGLIIGGGDVGGVAGKNFGTISYTYNNGNINGTGTYSGAIMGYGSGFVSNSYWDNETSGFTSSVGTAKTTAEMKTQSTYINWDFSNTWETSSTLNDGYPQLAWATTTSLIKSYSPQRVANSGTTTITFEGINFDSNTNIYLYKTGQDTLMADTISCSDTYCAAQFDFDNTSLGIWDIIVEYPDTTVKIENGLTFEEKKDIELNVSVIGPIVFRKNRPVVYSIKIENKGNNPAYFIPLNIAFNYKTQETISDLSIISDSLCQYKFSDIYADSSFVDEEELAILKEFDDSYTDLQSFVEFYDSTNEKYLLQNQIFIPEIKAYSSKIISIKIVSSNDIEIYASIPKNWDLEQVYEQSVSDLKTLASKSYQFKNSDKTVEDFVDKINCSIDLMDCLLNILSPIESPDPECLKSSLKNIIKKASKETLTSKYDRSSLIGDLETIKDGITDEKSFNQILSSIQLEQLKGMGEDILKASLQCILQKGIEKTVLKSVLRANVLFKAYDIGTSCIPAIYNATVGSCFVDNNEEAIFDSKSVNAFDPNDKYGYRSPSGSTYFNEDQTNFTYIINFENKETATAAAQEVFVTDTLDLNSFDIESFRAGYVKIGENIYDAPLNVQENKWAIDMRPDKDLITYVTLSLNKEEGIAKWYFRCVNPVSMDWPEDATAGFLPPNDSTGRGEGSVMFTINVKDSLPDDVSLYNKATIVFDSNDPIVTPTWSNKKDIIAPSSSMYQPLIVSDSTAALSWHAEDNKGGSGVYSYNVYMKKADEDYASLLTNTCDTSLAFKFTNDIEYSFYVTAIDSALNVEDKTNLPDVTLLVKTGIDDVPEQQKVKMNVYPNPASECSNLRIVLECSDGLSDYKRLIIYDMKGTVVKILPLTDTQIDVDGLDNGWYIFTLEIDNRRITSQKVAIL